VGDVFFHVQFGECRLWCDKGILDHPGGFIEICGDVVVFEIDAKYMHIPCLKRRTGGHGIAGIDGAGSVVHPEMLNRCEWQPAMTLEDLPEYRIVQTPTKWAMKPTHAANDGMFIVTADETKVAVVTRVVIFLWFRPCYDLVVSTQDVHDEAVERRSREFVADVAQNVAHGIHNTEKFRLDDTSMVIENLTETLDCIQLTGWLQLKTQALIVSTIKSVLGGVERYQLRDTVNDEKTHMVDNISDRLLNSDTRDMNAT
jgi:hypothetical protein